MKFIKNLTATFFIASIMLSCANSAVTQNTRQSAFSENSISIDSAINGASAYFAQRLPQAARVALVSFDTPAGGLSNYIFEEMWNRLEDSGFIMVDRRNLERIENEIMHQYGTGMVDDNMMVSLSKQAGAQILVYGQITSLISDTSAQEYRMIIYAIDVESAISSQRAYNVRLDNRLASLLNVPAEDAVEQAVTAMARSLDVKTTIAIGRISYGDTQTVSSFSAWLKNNIITSASRQNKLQVATDAESSSFAVASRGMTVDTPVANNSIQAVVNGSYTPLDTGIEVSLQLISTNGNKVILSSSRFFISAQELERRRLSLLPENNNTAITAVQFEQRQRILDSVSGGNNKWNFTVTPDVLDGIYYDGDYMTMRVYSEHDCYFRIIHIDVNGNTQLIYPLSPNDNNFIRAGETRRIPDNTRYRLHAPFGEEMVIVCAYDRPFIQSGFSGQLTEDSLSRGMTVESDSRTQMSPLATARFNYTILPRF